MEFNRKNIKTVLLIILFAVVIYTLARNVTVILSLLVKLSHVLATVTAGFCIAFILNVPLHEPSGIGVPRSFSNSLSPTSVILPEA